MECMVRANLYEGEKLSQKRILRSGAEVKKETNDAGLGQPSPFWPKKIVVDARQKPCFLKKNPPCGPLKRGKMCGKIEVPTRPGATLNPLPPTRTLI